MSKLKVNSGAKKRFRISANGMIKHKQSFARHNLTKKSSKRKRQMRHLLNIDKKDINRLQKMLGI